MTEQTLADALGRDYCDGEHSYERVDTIPWQTGRPSLDHRFETAVYECADCGAKRWSAEEKATSLEQWGAGA